MARDYMALRIGALVLVVAAVSVIVFMSFGGSSLLSSLTQGILPKRPVSRTVSLPAKPQQDSKTKKANPETDQAKITLNLGGRSGCLVCHSDRDAVGVIDGKTRPIFVDEELFKTSPHRDLTCLSCHLDFSYTHPVEVTDYKKVAGLACSRCHSHNKQMEDYRASVHGRLAMAGDPKGGATCGDCHGSHDIRSLKKSKEYRRAYRASAEEVCGSCHGERYKSYNDYYHGRAYKRGASDAPACWDCHDYHSVLPAKELASSVSSKNLAKTCGRCHRGSSRRFTEYALLVHSRKVVEEKNLVLRYKNLAFEWIGRTTKPYTQVSGGWFARYVKPYLERLRSWFFPESLRPKKD